MRRADGDPAAFQALLVRLETDPDPGNRQEPPGGCSAGQTRNAAAEHCGPPPPKTKTSRSAGSPGLRSGSLTGHPLGRPPEPARS